MLCFVSISNVFWALIYSWVEIVYCPFGKKYFKNEWCVKDFLLWLNYVIPLFGKKTLYEINVIKHLFLIWWNLMNLLLLRPKVPNGWLEENPLYKLLSFWESRVVVLWLHPHPHTLGWGGRAALCRDCGIVVEVVIEYLQHEIHKCY